MTALPVSGAVVGSEPSAAFTPGPWEARPDRTVAAQGLPLLRCYAGRNEAANALLIAASPDLFDSLDPETLEAIADEIDCFTHSARAAGLRGIAKRQRAAIAKAVAK